MNINVKQIGLDIWWAYFTREVGKTVMFEGDIFQGANAEALAKEWKP